MCKTRFNPIGKTVLLCYLLGAVLFGPGAQAKEGHVVWNPGSIEAILGFEGSQTFTATFSSAATLRDVSLHIVPELQRFVRVEPSLFASIEPDTPYTVSVYLTNPLGTYPGLYEGTVHLEEGRRTLPDTLKISLEVFYEGVTIPATTKVLGDETTQFLREASPTQLTFSQGTEELSRLLPGDVVIIGVTPVTPAGFIGRVLEITPVGTQVVIAVGPALLTDAVTDGSLQFSTLPLAHSMMARTALNSSTASTGEFYIQVEDIVLYDDDGDDETDYDQITAGGSLTISPEFDLDLVIEEGYLTYFSFVCTVEEAITLDLASEIELASVECEAEIPLPHIPVIEDPIVGWIGPVPVVILPDLSLYIGAEGSVSVGISASLEQEATITAGLEYDDGDWWPVNDFSNQFNMTLPTVSVGCDAKAYVKPEYSLMLYGLAGPYANIEAYLELEADPFATPWWELYGGLGVGVGAECEVLDLDYELPNLIGYRWLVGSAPTEEGYLSGTVRDAVSLSYLNDVSLVVYDGGSQLQIGQTGTDGSYNIAVPAGIGYQVVFSKPGYLTSVYNGVDVTDDMTTHLEVVLQIGDQYAGTGSASGHILNAVSGLGVTGMTIDLRSGINTRSGAVVASTVSANGGEYLFTDLDAGQYTGQVYGTGYNTTYFTLVCVGGMLMADQNATVTPVLVPGETRIVLTWGANPSDLDSHLTGPLPDGSRFHMYYPLKGSSSPWPEYVNLDLDDVTGYGPETTTIIQQIPGVYRFSVHDYTNRYSGSSTALSNSGAQVRVYRGSDIVVSFPVPTGIGGTLWTVFELNGDTIVPINALSYTSSPSGIQSLQIAGDDLFRDMPSKDEIGQTMEGDPGDFGSDEAGEAVALALFEAEEAIRQLPLEDFNADETANQLANSITGIFAMLDDGAYAEAMAVLESDILQRTDGCANTGEPDEDDWITSVEGQALVYPRVVEVIELLDSLI